MLTTSAPFLDDRWCARWRAAAARDPEIDHIGRWCTLDLVLSAKGRGNRFPLEAGRISDVLPWHEDRPGALVLDAPSEEWVEFFRAVPPRWHYDILGMERRVAGFRVVQGRDELIRHLRVLHRLVELARRDTDD